MRLVVVGRGAAKMLVESKLCGQKLSCSDNSHATPYVQSVEDKFTNDSRNHSGNNAQSKRKKNSTSPEVTQARAFF